METKLFFPNSKGDKLCAILSNPTMDKTRPIIIMMHGTTSSKNTKKFLTLQKIFDEAKISTFRFDGFGHGESEGKFEDLTVSEGIDGILQAIAYLKKQGYTRIGLIGSSFGGISSLIAASKTQDLFVLGLTCPVSDFEEVERRRRSEAEIQEWKERGFSYYTLHNGDKLKLNYAFFEDIKNNLGYEAAKQIKIPTIIVHGDADDDVPVEQSKKTAQIIPNCKLVIIHGADHRFTEQIHFDEMIQALSEFIINEAK